MADLKVWVGGSY